MRNIAYEGACHCGAITYLYMTDQAPEQWAVRACQCAFCRAHEALSTSNPGAELQFTAKDPDLLQRYRFALKTADFLVCRNCGVYVGAVIETPQGRFGIINTRTLVNIPDKIAGTQTINYDSENIDGRIARREQRWTPVVKLPS